MDRTRRLTLKEASTVLATLVRAAWGASMTQGRLRHTSPRYALIAQETEL